MAQRPFHPASAFWAVALMVAIVVFSQVNYASGGNTTKAPTTLKELCSENYEKLGGAYYEYKDRSGCMFFKRFKCHGATTFRTYTEKQVASARDCFKLAFKDEAIHAAEFIELDVGKTQCRLSHRGRYCSAEMKQAQRFCTDAPSDERRQIYEGPKSICMVRPRPDGVQLLAKKTYLKPLSCYKICEAHNYCYFASFHQDRQDVGCELLVDDVHFDANISRCIPDKRFCEEDLYGKYSPRNDHYHTPPVCEFNQASCWGELVPADLRRPIINAQDCFKQASQMNGVLEAASDGTFCRLVVNPRGCTNKTIGAWRTCFAFKGTNSLSADGTVYYCDFIRYKGLEGLSKSVPWKPQKAGMTHKQCYERCDGYWDTVLCYAARFNYTSNRCYVKEYNDDAKFCEWIGGTYSIRVGHTICTMPVDYSNKGKKCQAPRTALFGKIASAKQCFQKAANEKGRFEAVHSKQGCKVHICDKYG